MTTRTRTPEEQRAGARRAGDMAVEKGLWTPAMRADLEAELVAEEEGLCGMRKPGSSTTCIELRGHAGADGKGESHGDGSVIRWIYR